VTQSSKSDDTPLGADHGDDELLAADARDDGVAPAHVPQDVGDRDQRLVARGVPRRVVHAFECVEVQHDDPEDGGAVPDGLCGQRARGSVEATPVG
jgi:hypothetical protein